MREVEQHFFAAEEVVGYQGSRKNHWHDEECNEAAYNNYAAYSVTLRLGATRAMWNRYKGLKRKAKRIFLKKVRGQDTGVRRA